MDGVAEYSARILLVGLVGVALLSAVGLVAPKVYRTYRTFQCVETTADLAGCRARIK
jgi:hypothetical protein